MKEMLNSFKKIVWKIIEFSVFCLIPWMASFFFIPVAPNIVCEQFGIRYFDSGDHFPWASLGILIGTMTLCGFILPWLVYIVMKNILKYSEDEAQIQSRIIAGQAMVSFTVGLVSQFIFAIIGFFINETFEIFGSSMSNIAFFILCILFLIINLCSLFYFSGNGEKVMTDC